MSEVSINLNVLAAKQQSIVGIPKGTMKQLMELVDLVAEKKVKIKKKVDCMTICLIFLGGIIFSNVYFTPYAIYFDLFTG